MFQIGVSRHYDFAAVIVSFRRFLLKIVITKVTYIYSQKTYLVLLIESRRLLSLNHMMTELHHISCDFSVRLIW